MLHFPLFSPRNAARCVERRDEMRRRRGEEPRTDIIWRTGGWPARSHPPVTDRLVQRLHLHERHHKHFPQKSVCQHCLSRATAMTSNHSRAGTS